MSPSPAPEGWGSKDRERRRRRQGAEAQDFAHSGQSSVSVLYLCSQLIGMLMQLLLVYIFDIVSLKPSFQINLDM